MINEVIQKQLKSPIDVSLSTVETYFCQNKEGNVRQTKIKGKGTE